MIFDKTRKENIGSSGYIPLEIGESNGKLVGDGLRQSLTGYTIVEVMIFLVVSIGLFAGVVATYSQQNKSNQFSKGVNSLGQEIQDMLNDVDTGFYPTSENIQCSDGTPVVISEVPSTTQGTNEDCVFVGKAMQFTGSNYEVYTLAGKRDAVNIDGAGTQAVDFLKDSGSLPGGIEVTKVVSISEPGASLPSAVAVISTFGEPVSSAVAGSSLGNRSQISTLSGGGISSGGFLNVNKSPDVDRASQGLIICIQEAGGGETAIIEVGASSQQSVNVNIKSSHPAC